MGQIKDSYVKRRLPSNYLCVILRLFKGYLCKGKLTLRFTPLIPVNLFAKKHIVLIFPLRN
jgi:hypothetical protein